MISGHQRQFSGRPHRAERVEKLVDVFDFGCKASSLLSAFIVPMMSVVFQHGPTAGYIRDDGIDVLDIERGQIRIGKAASRFGAPGMEVNRPAAALRPRHEHVAAILLQNSSGRPIGVAKHYIAHTAGEQCDAGTSLADCRQYGRKWSLTTPRRRKHPHQLRASARAADSAIPSASREQEALAAAQHAQAQIALRMRLG